MRGTADQSVNQGIMHNGILPLASGQTMGFLIQVLHKPGTWTTAEISVGSGGKFDYKKDSTKRWLADVKVVNPQLQTDAEGRTIVRGELEGEIRTNSENGLRNFDSIVVAIAYDDAGKVVDVNYGSVTSPISGGQNNKLGFEITWQRTGVKISKYDFVCFSY